MPPMMLGIKQKALPYMPHGKDMAISSALIYIYTIVSKFDTNKNKIQYKLIRTKGWNPSTHKRVGLFGE